MQRSIGLTPIPDDVDIEKFLQKIRAENCEEMTRFLDELRATLEETENSGQPEVFAYGKMINYLAREESVTEPWLISVFAAAVWNLL